MRGLAWAAAVLASASQSPRAAVETAGSLLVVDSRSLVSRADITYNQAVTRSEEGLPIGNGRMGSLVWTLPAALKMQINRVDVFANGCASNSFPERHTDYCGGCGFVDVDFIEYGNEVFPNERTMQNLSCYDGLVTVAGTGVEARVLAWNERDVMAILPVVIKASEILNVDGEKRPLWQEFLDNLAPLPRSDNAKASPLRQRSGSPVWIKGLDPVVRGRGSSLPDGNTMPMWFFDLCTLETDPETIVTAQATFDAFFPNGVGPDSKVGVLSKLAVVAAVLGRSDAVRYLIPNQIQTKEIPTLAKRMALREGTQTTSVQRLGRVADALHTALCQDLADGPGRPPVIRVFPAWPREWDAEYTLLCRGGFLVTSTMRKGLIEFIEIQSQLGGECRLRNPWDRGERTL